MLCQLKSLTLQNQPCVVQLKNKNVLNFNKDEWILND